MTNGFLYNITCYMVWILWVCKETKIKQLLKVVFLCSFFLFLYNKIGILNTLYFVILSHFKTLLNVLVCLYYFDILSFIWLIKPLSFCIKNLLFWELFWYFLQTSFATTSALSSAKLFRLLPLLLFLKKQKTSTYFFQKSFL